MMNKEYRFCEDICNEINSQNNLDYKVGVNKNTSTIIFYNYKLYDEMFGLQTYGQYQIDESKVDDTFYKQKVHFEICKRLATISDSVVVTATQK